MKRDRKLFEVFVRENQGALIAYLRAIVSDHAMAEDLFQETMLTAWKKFDEFDTSKPLAPWLRGIALNLARNATRKRIHDHVGINQSIVDLAEDWIGSIEARRGDTWKQRLDVLAGCVGRLPDRSRKLVHATYVDGLTSASLAEEVGGTADLIRKRLQRIRRILADCVRDHLAEVEVST